MSPATTRRAPLSMARQNRRGTCTGDAQRCHPRLSYHLETTAIMTSPSRLLVTCDVDPDRAEFGGPPYTSRELRWDGLETGIRRLVEGAESRGFRDFRATWFIRADDQVETTQGDPAWCFTTYESLWKELLAKGHELGWHLHLWKWKETHWAHEHGDLEWISEMAWRANRAIPAWARPGGRATDPLPLRMGINHHTNETVRLASDLGIRFDCTPVPGIADQFRDWVGTPRRAYRPASQDCRMAEEGGGRENGILFIPASTYPLPAAAYLAKRLLGRTGRVAEPYLTKSRTLLRMAYRNAAHSSDSHFLISFHADELLPLHGRFSLRNALLNLGFLRALDQPFKTVTQFGEESLGGPQSNRD